jgi:hypothetical protein
MIRATIIHKFVSNSGEFFEERETTTPVNFCNVRPMQTRTQQGVRITNTAIVQFDFNGDITTISLGDIIQYIPPWNTSFSRFEITSITPNQSNLRKGSYYYTITAGGI